MARERRVASPIDDRAVLRMANLRVTKQRLVVLERLREATAPISHAELAEILGPEGIDRAVVYRVLMDLVAAGLVDRSAHGHIWRFELIREGSKHASQHPHFTCTDCGAVACLEAIDAPLTKIPLPKGARLETVELKGRCVDCS